jgi:hypothetical protein
MEREVRIKTILKFALTAVIAAAITFVIVKITTPERQATVLEQNAVKDFSAKVMSHMEELDFDTSNVDSSNESNPVVNGYPLDRYIAYALEYSYDRHDKSELSTTEIKELIARLFDIELDSEKLNGVGVSPLLLDKHIGHEPINQVYNIRKEYTKRDIADIPVSAYVLNEIKVNSENTIYTVTYNKYTAKNPYDILPHANSNADVNAYLNGKGKISSIKALITADNAESISAAEKQTTVEYIVKDGELRVKSIK